MNNHEEPLNEFITGFKEIKEHYRSALFDRSFQNDLLKNNLEMIRNRKYAITDSLWQIPEKEHGGYFISLLELTHRYAKEYAEDIEKISMMIRENETAMITFITDILTNKQKKLHDFARKHKISIDFITFLAIFSAFPYREAVADAIRQEISLKNHVSGFCPVCGHWPGMSYITEKEGKKIMACICCGTVWSFQRMRCSFCLSSDPDQLAFLTIEGEEGISAYTCDSCRRYLKTVKMDRFPDDFKQERILLDFMSSGTLDIAALQNKFLQESILGTRFDGPSDPRIESYIKCY